METFWNIVVVEFSCLSGESILALKIRMKPKKSIIIKYIQGVPARDEAPLGLSFGRAIAH